MNIPIPKSVWFSLTFSISTLTQTRSEKRPRRLAPGPRQLRFSGSLQRDLDARSPPETANAPWNGNYRQAACLVRPAPPSLNKLALVARAAFHPYVRCHIDQ